MINKILNRKGFTLIELLATLTIMSVVLSITLFIAIDIIGKSKEKSYQVTKNNIEEAAKDYFNENSNKLFFQSLGAGSNEYQCITVQNLIDTGYFDNQITNSPISASKTVLPEDYIYMERNSNTKAITKSVYVDTDGSGYDIYCNSAINAKGNIAFSIEPSGWSKSKNITISYQVRNTLNLEDYRNSYKYIVKTTEKKSNNNTSSPTIVTVDENGTIYASITDIVNSKVIKTNSQDITKIDVVGPVITYEYTGSSSVKGSVTIPIKVSDYGIGLDKSTFTKDDIIVKVGGIKLDTIELKKSSKSDNESSDTKYYYYDLIINSTLNGDVSVVIDGDNIFDKLGNSATVGKLSLLTFNNVYNIEYEKGSNVTSIGKTTDSCTIDPSTGSCNVILPSITAKTGYKVVGWNVKKGSTSGKASGSELTLTEDNVVYYANAVANTYTINYQLDGGTNASSGVPTKYTYGVGATINGKPTKSDYTFIGWSDSSALTNAKFTQTISKTDTGNKNYYAKWCQNCAAVSNGGCALDDTTEGTCTYNTYCNKGYSLTAGSATRNPTCTDNTPPSLTVVARTEGGVLLTCSNNGSASVTCTAPSPAPENGVTLDVTASDEGSGLSSDKYKLYWNRVGQSSYVETIVNTGEENDLSGSRTLNSAGYRVLWIRVTDKAGNQAEVKLKIQITKTQYKITYDDNGGSGGPGVQYKQSGVGINISNQTPTRSGYLFSNWYKSNSCSGTKYTPGQSYSSNADLKLYACWKQIKVTVTDNIDKWVCGKCTTYCSDWQAKSGGSCIKTFDGKYGNTVGKVTSSGTNQTKTFSWQIYQGKETWIAYSYYVDFIVKNNSGTQVCYKRIKNTSDVWGMGSSHSGTVSCTFSTVGTYYIYIEGNSKNPSFSMNFGTIKVELS